MGLIDREMISELRLGHCSVFGFPGKNSGELITTMEAYKLGMITEDSAVRVLSIQVIKVPLIIIVSNFKNLDFNLNNPSSSLMLSIGFKITLH